MLRSSMLLALLAATGFVSPARADTTACTPIVTVPATISAPGVYCLKAHRITSMTSGAAITIAADDVTLDCNQFKLHAITAGTQAVGVQSTNRSRVTVRHCNLRGFRTGINFSGGRHALIEDNQVIASSYQGMQLSATNESIVRRNRILSTGSNAVASAMGIRNEGGRSLLLQDNTITVVRSASLAVGILSNGSLGVIKGNRISDLKGSSTGVRGIHTSLGNVLVLDNFVRVAMDNQGKAIRALPNGDAGVAVCRDNDQNGFTVAPYEGCLDGRYY